GIKQHPDEQNTPKPQQLAKPKHRVVLMGGEWDSPIHAPYYYT
ncbi:hypothetical protein SAMN02745664_11928, partial [Moraxella cuniculi DSM 21768]